MFIFWYTSFDSNQIKYCLSRYLMCLSKCKTWQHKWNLILFIRAFIPFVRHFYRPLGSAVVKFFFIWRDALIGQVRVPGIHFDRDVVLWIQFWTMRPGFFWWKINVLTLNEFKCEHYLWRRSCTTVFAGECQWLYFTNHGVEECVRRQKPGWRVCAPTTQKVSERWRKAVSVDPQKATKEWMEQLQQDRC